jgi:hypothetical protein
LRRIVELIEPGADFDEVIRQIPSRFQIDSDGSDPLRLFL